MHSRGQYLKIIIEEYLKEDKKGKKKKPTYGHDVRDDYPCGQRLKAILRVELERLRKKSG